MARKSLFSKVSNIRNFHLLQINSFKLEEPITDCHYISFFQQCQYSVRYKHLPSCIYLLSCFYRQLRLRQLRLFVKKDLMNFQKPMLLSVLF